MKAAPAAVLRAPGGRLDQKPDREALIVCMTITTDPRLTDTETDEAWPEILDPVNMVARGIYDTAPASAVAALWLVAGWVTDQLEHEADADEFTRRITWLRDRTEYLMDARWQAAES